MISYNEEPFDPTRKQGYARGWKVAATDDIDRIGRGISRYAWSPIVWRGGHRREENFLSAHWCVLDFDSPDMTLAEATKTFCDCVHLIGTTKSHQREKDGITCDRFRVAVRFDEPVTDLRTYRYIMYQMVQSFPCDKKPKDGARFFYPCREVTSSDADGYTQDSRVEVPEWFDRRANTKRMNGYIRAGILPPWPKWQLSHVIPEGERNDTIYRLAKDLTRFGMSLEEIIERVVNSPTYQGQVSAALLAEIEYTARNGARKALTEMTGKGDAEHGTGPGQG